MARALLSSDSHRLKNLSLRVTMTSKLDARQVGLNRAIIETLRNPVVARAVARGLQLDQLQEA